VPPSRKELQEVSSRVYPDLERVPGKQNWVDKTGGLPSYIERIAKHMHYERGRPIGQAIASAVATTKRWCSTGKNWNGGDLKPTTRAKACKAVASWESKKARSKAKTAAKKLKESTEMQEARELLEANTALPCDDNVAKELAGLVRKRLTIAEGMLPALREPKTVGKQGLVKKAIELLEADLTEPVSIGMIGGPAADPRDMKKVADLLESEVEELRALAESLGEDVKPWEKKNPKGKKGGKKLTPEQKAKAKRRAKKAGRKYPNLVDNMAAAQMQEGAGPWMKEGDSGEQVKEMQRQVEGMGRYIGDAGADGKFGYQTKQGVKAVQRREGLKADGIVGPETKSMLDSKMPPAEMPDAPSETPEKEEAEVPSWDSTSAARRLRAAKKEMQEATDKGAIAGWLDMVAKAAMEQDAGALAGMFKDKTWPTEWDADIDEMLYEGEDDKLEAMREVIGAIRDAGDMPLDKSFFESLFMDDMDDREEMAEADVAGSGTAEAATDGNTVTAPPGPPNLRESRGGDMNCGTCESFEGGKCVAHNASVSPTQVCDDWKADGEMAEGMKVEVEVKIEKGKKDKGEGYEEGYEQEGREDCGCDKGDHAYCPNCGMTHGSSSCGCGHEWEGDEKYCPECGSANKPIIAVLEGPEIAEATIDNRLRGAAMSGLRGLASNRSGWTAARKAAIKRLSDGTFAPKGRGRVLYPGDNVDLGGTRGKVDLDGQSITLGNGRKLKLNKAAQAAPQMATPTSPSGADRTSGKVQAPNGAQHNYSVETLNDDGTKRITFSDADGKELGQAVTGPNADIQDYLDEYTQVGLGTSGPEASRPVNPGMATPSFEVGDTVRVAGMDDSEPNLKIARLEDGDAVLNYGDQEVTRAPVEDLELQDISDQTGIIDDRMATPTADRAANLAILSGVGEGQKIAVNVNPDTSVNGPDQGGLWELEKTGSGWNVTHNGKLIDTFATEDVLDWADDEMLRPTDFISADNMATPTSGDRIPLANVEVGEFVKAGSPDRPIYGKVTAQTQGTGFSGDTAKDRFGSVEVTSKDGTKHSFYRGIEAQVVPEEEAMAAPAPLDPPNPGPPRAPGTMMTPTRKDVMADIERMAPGDSKTFANGNIRVMRSEDGYSVSRKENSWDDTFDIEDGEGFDASKAAELVSELAGDPESVDMPEGTYAERVARLESEGMTTSDAQAAAGAEGYMATPSLPPRRVNRATGLGELARGTNDRLPFQTPAEWEEAWSELSPEQQQDLLASAEEFGDWPGDKLDEAKNLARHLADRKEEGAAVARTGIIDSELTEEGNRSIIDQLDRLIADSPDGLTYGDVSDELGNPDTIVRDNAWAYVVHAGGADLKNYAKAAITNWPGAPRRETTDLPENPMDGRVRPSVYGEMTPSESALIAEKLGMDDLFEIDDGMLSNSRKKALLSKVGRSKAGKPIAEKLEQVLDGRLTNEEMAALVGQPNATGVDVIGTPPGNDRGREILQGPKREAYQQFVGGWNPGYLSAITPEDLNNWADSLEQEGNTELADKLRRNAERNATLPRSFGQNSADTPATEMNAQAQQIIDAAIGDKTNLNVEQVGDIIDEVRAGLYDSGGDADDIWDLPEYLIPYMNEKGLLGPQAIDHYGLNKSGMATPTFDWDDVGEAPPDQIPAGFPEFDQDGIKTRGVVALADLPDGASATDAQGRRYRKLGAGSVQGSVVIEGPEGDLWQQDSGTMLIRAFGGPAVLTRMASVDSMATPSMMNYRMETLYGPSKSKKRLLAKREAARARQAQGQDGRRLTDEPAMDEGDIQDMLDYQYRLSMMTPTNPPIPELAAEGSPVRSGAGRIRNVGAMNNEKLLRTLKQQQQWNTESQFERMGLGDPDGTRALESEITYRLALDPSDPKALSPADLVAEMAMATPTREAGDRLDISDITGTPGDSATLIAEVSGVDPVRGPLDNAWQVQSDRTGQIFTIGFGTAAKLDTVEEAREMATPGRIQNFVESGDLLRQVEEPDADIADSIEVIDGPRELGDGLSTSVLAVDDQRFTVQTPTAIHDQVLSRLDGEMAGDFDPEGVEFTELAPRPADTMELPLGSKLANVPTTKSYVTGREIVTPLTADDLTRVEDGVLDGKVVNMPVGPYMNSPTAKMESTWRQQVLQGRNVELPGGTKVLNQDGTVRVSHQGLVGAIHADGLAPEDRARVAVQAANALDAFDRGEFDDGAPARPGIGESASRRIFEAALDGEPDELAEISGLSPDNFVTGPDWMATPTTPNPTPLPGNYNDNNEAIEFQHLPMGSYFADAGGYTYVLHKPAGSDGKWYIAKPVDPEGNIITDDPHPDAGSKKAHGPTRRIFHFRQPPRSLGGMHQDYVEDHDVTGSSQVPDATDAVTQPDAPETVVTGKYGIEAYEAGSPVRSPKGNVRNLKAMSNAKFLGVYDDMQAYATIDPEGFERVNAEYGRRTSLPLDDPKTLAQPETPTPEPTPEPPAATAPSIPPFESPGLVPIGPATINPKMSPARSPKGNVRNIKAMNNDKLKGLITQMISNAGDGNAWAIVDSESWDKITEVAEDRGIALPGKLTTAEEDKANSVDAPDMPSGGADLPESERGIYNAIKSAVDGDPTPAPSAVDTTPEEPPAETPQPDSPEVTEPDAPQQPSKLGEVGEILGMTGDDVNGGIMKLRERGVDIDVDAESAETIAAVLKATGISSASMATPTMAPAYGDQLGSASDILTPDEIQSIVDGAPGVSIASSIADGNIPSVPRLERLKLLLPEDGTAATAVDKLIGRGSPSMATPTLGGSDYGVGELSRAELLSELGLPADSDLSIDELRKRLRDRREMVDMIGTPEPPDEEALAAGEPYPRTRYE
jgi:hypothetical protein